MESKQLEIERAARNLLAAAVRVRTGLDQRIVEASRVGGTTPIFDGMALLNDSIDETKRALAGLDVLESSAKSQI